MNEIQTKLSTLQHRLQTWQFTKLWLLDSFDDPSQEKVIMAAMPEQEEYIKRKAKMENAKKGSPFEFLFMYTEPILTATQEKHFLQQYNFLKYKYKTLAETTDLKHNQILPTIKKLEDYYIKMGEVKQKLVCSNGRLVMNLAKKANTLNLETSLSDGYLGLTMAVDYFDFRRPLKFVTYCYIVIKDFIRKNQLDGIKINSMFTHDEMMEANLADYATPTGDEGAVKLERSNIVKKTLLQIPEREREVISYYYGLDGRKEHTLDEIGQKLRISKERVRQIKTVGIERIKRIKVPYEGQAERA